jgi:hypothetical protein
MRYCGLTLKLALMRQRLPSIGPRFDIAIWARQPVASLIWMPLRIESY